MRLFLGFPLSENIAAQAVAWQDTRADLPVRWVAPQDMHMTLVAPWERDDLAEDRERIQNVLSSFDPFPLVFDQISFGPRPQTPRLIWAKGSCDLETTRRLERMRGALREALGLPKDARPFTPHVTLARFPSESFNSFPMRELNDLVLWEESFSSAVLFESHGKNERGEYFSRLATFPRGSEIIRD